MTDLVPSTPKGLTSAMAVRHHVKLARVAINDHVRSGVRFLLQAAAAGAHMESIVELLPHGDGEKVLAEEFPDISDSTRKLWRQFSRRITDAVKTKTPTVGLLDVKGKLTIGKKNAPVFLGLIPELMEGKTMVQMARGIKLLPAPKPDGGFRPNAEELAKWIAKHHPELKGVEFEKLPAEVQKAFKEFFFAQAAKPDTEEPKEQTKLLRDHLLQSLHGKWLMRCTPDQRADLLLLTEKLADKIKTLNQAAKKK